MKYHQCLIAILLLLSANLSNAQDFGIGLVKNFNKGGDFAKGGLGIELYKSDCLDNARKLCYSINHKHYFQKKHFETIILGNYYLGNSSSIETSYLFGKKGANIFSGGFRKNDLFIFTTITNSHINSYGFKYPLPTSNVDITVESKLKRKNDELYIQLNRSVLFDWGTLKSQLGYDIRSKNTYVSFGIYKYFFR